MKNKSIDLNNHLFEQLERLNDDTLKGQELESEIERSKAVCNVSRQIIENGKLVLAAKKHIDEYGLDNKELPLMLSGDK